MAKTRFETESWGTLVYMCEGKRLPHTGNREALIARLVEAEQAEEPEPEPNPEVEPPAPEPGTTAALP